MIADERWLRAKALGGERCSLNADAPGVYPPNDETKRYEQDRARKTDCGVTYPGVLTVLRLGPAFWFGNNKEEAHEMRRP